MALDIYSCKIVGWEVHCDELASDASELVSKVARKDSADALHLSALLQGGLHAIGGGDAVR